jgi:predicted ATPase
MELSEGNPYYYYEVVRYLLENELLSIYEGEDFDASSMTAILPKTIISYIRVNLRALSDAARRILDAGSAIGRSFRFDLLVHTSALSEDAALDGLEELCTMGLLNQDGNKASFLFSHDITRKAIYDDINITRRQWFHGRIAENMDSMRLRLSEYYDASIAYHFLKSNEPERSVPFSLLAAGQAIRLGAMSEAVLLFEQALPFLDAVDQHDVIHEMAILRSGDINYKAGLDMYRRCASLAESLGYFDYVEMHKASIQLIMRSDIYELYWGMDAFLRGVPIPDLCSSLHSALKYAKERNASAVIVYANMTLSFCECLQGNSELAVGYAEEGLSVATNALQDEIWQQRLLLTATTIYCSSLRAAKDDRALPTIQKGMQIAKESGFLLFQPSFYSQLMKAHLSTGNFEAAEASFDAGIVIAEQIGMKSITADLICSRGVMLMEQGNTEDSVELFRKALEMATNLELCHLSAKASFLLAKLMNNEESSALLEKLRTIALKGNYSETFSDIEDAYLANASNTP